MSDLHHPGSPRLTTELIHAQHKLQTRLDSISVAFADLIHEAELIQRGYYQGAVEGVLPPWLQAALKAARAVNREG